MSLEGISSQRCRIGCLNVHDAGGFYLQDHRDISEDRIARHELGNEASFYSLIIGIDGTPATIAHESRFKSLSRS